MSGMNKNVRNALLLLLALLFEFFFVVFADLTSGESIGTALCCNFFLMAGGTLWFIIFEYEDKK
jgi:hypothetical protein